MSGEQHDVDRWKYDSETTFSCIIKKFNRYSKHKKEAWGKTKRVFCCPCGKHYNSVTLTVMKMMNTNFVSHGNRLRQNPPRICWLLPVTNDVIQLRIVQLSPKSPSSQCSGNWWSTEAVKRCSQIQLTEQRLQRHLICISDCKGSRTRDSIPMKHDALAYYRREIIPLYWHNQYGLSWCLLLSRKISDGVLCKEAYVRFPGTTLRVKSRSTFSMK